jgi:hypothetical protein
MDKMDKASQAARLWSIAVNTAETDYLGEMIENMTIDDDLRLAGKMYQMNRKQYPRYRECGLLPIRVHVSPFNNYAGITKL